MSSWGVRARLRDALAKRKVIRSCGIPTDSNASHDSESTALVPLESR